MESAAGCGVSERDFWDMTPRYFSAHVEAAEQKEQNEWERARYVSMHAIKAADGSNKIKKPTDLGYFPWEDSTQPIIVVDPVEIEAFDKEADEILKKANPEAYAAYISGKNG